MGYNANSYSDIYKEFVIQKNVCYNVKWKGHDSILLLKNKMTKAAQ